MNRILALGLGPDALHRAASLLGSDVPFFLVGGTALGLGRGEDLYPLPDLPSSWVVLARPPFGVSTVEAYRWYASEGGIGTRSASTTRDSSRSLAIPWRAGGLELANDLERVVLPRHPEIAAVRRHLLRRGAQAALMAGSGSTVFGLFGARGAAQEAAEAVAAPGWTVLVTRTLGRTAYLRRLEQGFSRASGPRVRRVAGPGTIG